MTLLPLWSRSDPLTKDQQKLATLPLKIPAGYGMRTLSDQRQLQKWHDVGSEPAPLDTLLVWEAPRRNHLYVVSADLSSGQKLDYSCADVTRVPTLREPAEQVAQFRTNTIDETDFAYVLDAIGRLYTGRDNLPALIAPETNAMGVATVRELDRHIGYPNIFVWRYWDTVDPSRDKTNKYGWTTTTRSRPIMLQNYVHQIRTVDPHTGFPDYRINSPATLEELSSFQSPGPLWMAEAVDGAHDDTIMAGAIGLICIKLEFESLGETLHDQRRRTSEEVARAEAKMAKEGRKEDFQNSDSTYEQMMGRDDWQSMDAEDQSYAHLHSYGDYYGDYGMSIQPDPARKK